MFYLHIEMFRARHLDVVGGAMSVTRERVRRRARMYSPSGVGDSDFVQHRLATG